jgi:hypothetical protein
MADNARKPLLQALAAVPADLKLAGLRADHLRRLVEVATRAARRGRRAAKKTAVAAKPKVGTVAAGMNRHVALTAR